MIPIFRRLTLIDYLVSFLVISGLLVFLIFFSRQKAEFYSTLIMEDVRESTLEPYSPLTWIAHSLKPGDASFDGSGSKIAEVVALESVESGENRTFLKIKLKLFGIYDRRTKQYRINDMIVKVGETINLDIAHTNVTAKVAYVGGEDSSEKATTRKLHLKLIVEYVPSWQAASYNTEFTVINRQGDTIFKITEVDTRPAVKTVTTATGEIRATTDPIYKDVEIIGEVTANCYQDGCFFNNTFPVRIGETWKLQSTTTQIQGAKVVEILTNE